MTVLDIPASAKKASAQAPASPAKPSVRAAILAMIIGLVLGCATIEIGARLTDTGMNFDIEMWKYARALKRVSANPEIAHEHRPGTSGTFMGVPVQINSMGLRDREHPLAKPPGTTRILMLGDSLAFGWGVKEQDTPSRLLETRLNAGGSANRYEVINSGVGNYNSAMEIAYFFEHGRKFHPDIVVLNYFINDAEPTPRKKSSFLIENSQAAVLIGSAIDKLTRQYFGKSDWKTYYADLYHPQNKGWQITQQSIARLAAYCRANGIKLLIANYPELHELRPYPFGAVTNAVRDVARTNDVPFIDLEPAVAELQPRSLWVSSDDAHPNAIANARYAAALETDIKQMAPRETDGPKP